MNSYARVSLMYYESQWDVGAMCKTLLKTISIFAVYLIGLH